MTDKRTLARVHLGDGIYARFDGEAMHLETEGMIDAHILMEPDVLKRLCEFASAVNAAMAEIVFTGRIDP